MMTSVNINTRALVAHRECGAAGCKREPIVDHQWCSIHDRLFGEGGTTCVAAQGKCPRKRASKGLCLVHLRRFERWQEKLQSLDPTTVEVWLTREWDRPIGEEADTVQREMAGARCETRLMERIRADLRRDEDGAPSETMAERLRSVIETYARGLPEPVRKKRK
jgi:hypothetical protein